jgi:hypothetical protein
MQLSSCGYKAVFSTIQSWSSKMSTGSKAAYRRLTTALKKLAPTDYTVDMQNSFQSDND